MSMHAKVEKSTTKKLASNPIPRGTDGLPTPLPTTFQPPSNPVPKGVCSNPPIPPGRLEHPPGWNPGGPTAPLRGKRLQSGRGENVEHDCRFRN
jgi:hypothetical protein